MNKEEALIYLKNKFPNKKFDKGFFFNDCIIFSNSDIKKGLFELPIAINTKTKQIFYFNPNVFDFNKVKEAMIKTRFEV